MSAGLWNGKTAAELTETEVIAAHGGPSIHRLHLDPDLEALVNDALGADPAFMALYVTDRIAALRAWLVRYELEAAKLAR